MNKQASRLSERLRSELGTGSVWAVHYTRGTRRIFFVLPAPSHTGIVGSRIERWLASGWNSHGFLTKYGG